ncbi:MAG: biotin synthase BioB [Xanthomonadales bacterium]|nr:biotin synthase BioB [Xanthomonadales bacterium]
MTISNPHTQTITKDNTALRHDWSSPEVLRLFNLPFNDLLFRAHSIHRQQFDPNQVQISTLLSIKTGACPEDCKYCPQSVHYDTGLEREKLLPVEDVVAAANAARETGATRFCMGAAWRQPSDRNLEKVIKLISAVRETGMETCVTLGMLSDSQALRLKEAGLDYYNHNLDTSPEFYSEVVKSRTYDDRLDTLKNVRDAGLNVCCGGIVGMGESRTDRAGLLVELANLPIHPQSVPINQLIRVAGTPMESLEDLDELEFVRTIAITRIMMPHSVVRLSAGRTEMSDSRQTLCFFAGANSIFYGEKLLTADNPEAHSDKVLFEKLGINRKNAAAESAA